MDSLVQNRGAYIANALDTAVLYFPQLIYELLLELLMVFLHETPNLFAVFPLIPDTSSLIWSWWEKFSSVPQRNNLAP